MLHDKSTTNLSELKNFFTKGNVIPSIFRGINLLKFEATRFGFTEAKNEKISSKIKLFLLIFFPFFNIKNPYNYCKSNIYNLFACKKDVFYRLLKRSEIRWRSLVQNLTKQLISNAAKSQGTTKKGHPKCLILDDTDIPKTGKRIEFIGKVYSHAIGRQILGFKALFLSYFDGTSFFSFDMSLKGEMGTDKEKPQGITRNQAKKRYRKGRKKKKAVNKREIKAKNEEKEAEKQLKRTETKKRLKEYFLSKIKVAKDMIKNALKSLSVEYVLFDSWYTCEELVKLITTHKSKVNFLGMIKMGKTKYKFEGKYLNSKELVEKLKKNKKLHYSWEKKMYYSSCEVDFQGIPVKLFFAKEGKRGDWKGMMSNNLSLTFQQACEIYALRWMTEVFFKDAKQYLKLGKCQSVDFDSQIASMSIVMLQYNLLSFSKRLTDYQTIGGMFEECQKDSIELTLAERLLALFNELLFVIVDILPISIEEIIKKIINGDNEILTEMVNLLKSKEKLKIAN